MNNPENYNIIIYDVNNLKLAIKKGKEAYRAKYQKAPSIVVLSHRDMVANKLEPGDTFHGLKVEIYASSGTVQIGE